MELTGALDRQVGGDHYKVMGIQPIEYIQANGLGFCEGNAVKYVTRWRAKGGVQDLEKAIHYLQLLIEFERSAEKAPKEEVKLSPLVPAVPVFTPLEVTSAAGFEPATGSWIDAVDGGRTWAAR